MTEATVNSRICGHVHKIKGELKGDKIIIDIETPCKNVKKISHLEVPMMEIMKIKDNYVMEKAQEANCGANCLVPCAIINVCKLESEFIAKSLAKKAGSIEITFDDL
ncbi:hypothetical protein MSMTP_0622 [Methanosarcina sp. MTP4]|uniref:DUF6951 family protein n=1 Tax=unclassified Methanosarcina TaxID=2644672 RepID=UPI000615817C|nr:hypothetical protein [Methanosarcina sp. MTP4]AKB24091.1 hypothetical protein MSMTP_0622 [Methanosarcina sp. MTP4]